MAAGGGGGGGWKSQGSRVSNTVITGTWTGGDQTACGDHMVRGMNVESLDCTSDTSIVYQLHLNKNSNKASPMPLNSLNR